MQIIYFHDEKKIILHSIFFRIMLQAITVKHFATLREFRDRLKVAKFNTCEQEKIKFVIKKMHKPPSLSILAIVNVSADSVNIVDFDKSSYLYRS